MKAGRHADQPVIQLTAHFVDDVVGHTQGSYFPYVGGRNVNKQVNGQDQDHGPEYNAHLLGNRHGIFRRQQIVGEIPEHLRHHQGEGKFQNASDGSGKDQVPVRKNIAKSTKYRILFFGYRAVHGEDLLSFSECRDLLMG